MFVMIKRKDGGVSIMRLFDVALEAAALAPEHLDTIVQAEVSGWAQKDQDNVVSWRPIDPATIPEDRTFRNAWCDTSPEPIIDIDMPKARDVWRDKMRQARAPMLVKLDERVLRAAEANADTTLIVAAKQALRDVTADPAIEAAKTPDELRAVWPDCLKP